MDKVKIRAVKSSPQAQADRIKGRVFKSYRGMQDFLDYAAVYYSENVKISTKREPVKKRLLHDYQKNAECGLAILSLILGSGLRVNEVVSLNVSDIDWREPGLEDQK
ncbi:hypothetical protein [Fervidibacillus halotolerans]|uniref:Uncharacterized protein n=1 Tax=Fervidibacillus halotolerans TaxID=2980027 RepID=A0A9E8LZC2_9BACI|nr:hypothetical protein [Fervidibacillus halotolerans]WAA12598.1 hypothetical protein OE105_00135 [Fervidibacillus halotolerans]